MPRSVELFAGGGGMALGMLNAGFEHDQLVELHPQACGILTANAERTPERWKKESVRQLDVRTWLAEVSKLGLQDIDLVAGGPPCQPFSISGKGVRAGYSDERNMFPAAVDAVRNIRPKAFVFENVPGLLRESFFPYYEYICDQLERPSIAPKGDEEWSSHHDRIKGSLEHDLEYRVYRQTIDAADLGVPQNRKRVFIVGIRADVRGSDAWGEIGATHSRDALLYDQWVSGEYWQRYGISPPEAPARFAARIRELRGRGTPMMGQEPWRTTRDAIRRLPKPVNGVDAHGILNHRGIPGARIYKGHTGGWIDWPAKTLKAGVHGVCGGEAMIRFSGDEVRYLTVREAARVQTFPDDYELPAVRSVAMRALGNAVAVAVAEVIGRRLIDLTGIGDNGNARSLGQLII
ncbi:DNA cytosine methyltransferase [Micromonospora coxensis]|uniref:DNA cytosine methyltransferase n=1 Tax=Micromonospora coxensis TaxID=356852 RepID=UPI003412BDF0